MGGAAAGRGAGGPPGWGATQHPPPPIDAGRLARFVVERGRQVGLVDVFSAGCVTTGRAGQRLAHLDEPWAAGGRPRNARRALAGGAAGEGRRPSWG